MTHPLIEQLRTLVDARYAEVRDAIDVLDRHLRRAAVRPRARSIREAVLRELQAGERTVDQIATATGLRKRQIRGVLNARDLTGTVVQKRERAGVMFYRLANQKDRER